jgi:adenine/guanine/hypoxanthine permease
MVKSVEVKSDYNAPVIERFFRLREHQTTVRIEVVAGLTTFMAMAYIIFVQPTVLGAAGMDFGAVLVATCLASALATVLMGVMANYPIAIAPAMGHNFYFVFAVVVGMKVSWPIALGGVFIAGVIFVVTAGFGLRETLITAIPDSLKHAIAAGIGLLIALIGLEWAGFVIAAPGTLVALGPFKGPPVLLALFGLVVMAALLARKTSGALLLGMAATTVAGLATGVLQFQGVFSAPPSLAPTLMKLDVLGALQPAMAPVIAIFFFLALFDSVGTLVGVAGQAGLMRGRELPRAREALLADATGTVAGALLGTSTVTAYVESATGVSAGGRTGLANMVTAFLFLAAIFCAPLVKMIGGGYALGDGRVLYPVIAPALILVGTMMVPGVRAIGWDDPTEGIPAFLTILVMPLAVSITDGIAFGFISYAFLKLVTGRASEAHWLVYLSAALFVVRYAFLAR